MRTAIAVTTATLLAAATTALAPAASAESASTGSASTGAASAGSAAATSAHRASATLVDPSGKKVGTATFRSSNGGVTVTVRASGLKPGFHGLHLHEIGTCKAPSPDPKDSSKKGAFLSAGGHWTLGKASHANHSGDLPPLLVGKKGTGSLTTWTDRFAVKNLLDKDGNSIMIHAGSDNLANIPDRYSEKGPDAETKKAGDGGDRAACGVIRR